MASKSMTDIAYEVMLGKKRAVQFLKLWEDVSKISKASDDMIGQFYSDLTLDTRFAALADNKWDLAERRKYSESHVDISKIELASDDVDEIDNDDVDNKSEDDKY